MRVFHVPSRWSFAQPIPSNVLAGFQQRLPQDCICVSAKQGQRCALSATPCDPLTPATLCRSGMRQLQRICAHPLHQQRRNIDSRNLLGRPLQSGRHTRVSPFTIVYELVLQKEKLNSQRAWCRKPAASQWSAPGASVAVRSAGTETERETIPTTDNLFTATSTTPASQDPLGGVLLQCISARCNRGLRPHLWPPVC